MTRRAFEPLTREHLAYLAQAAADHREGLFRRRPHLTFFRERILCVALCQGGALHYVDGINGVKDLDIWTFYGAGGDRQYPPRCGGDAAAYPASGLTGWSERLDIWGRSIQVLDNPDPVESVLHYLRTKPTRSAWHLAKKPVVLLEPAARLGEVIWPEAA